MPNCAIKWCGNRSTTSNILKDGITFHRFPKKCPLRKNVWIDATQRGADWYPASHSVICSRHFTSDCFYRIKNNKHLLFRHAVPTLFLPLLSGVGQHCGSDDMVEMKEELGGEEVDIGPTTFQYQDAHYTTRQPFVSVVKLESELDATLYDGVKLESNEFQLTGAGGLRCAQATSAPAPVGVGSVKQRIHITVEGTNLVIGPSMLQHRTNQQNTSVVKTENTIAYDGNDPLLCSREKEGSDACGESCRYSCDYCPKTFIYKKNLQIHITCMHASCSFKCDQCRKSYKCKPYLMSHMRRMHGDEQLQCKVCGEIVQSRYYFQQHMKGHTITNKPLLCSREKEGSDTCGATEPNIYICDYCHKTFPNKNYLKRHITCVHSSRLYKCNLSCDQCGKSYKCKRYLFMHKANVHSATGQSTMRCNICGASYKPRNLRSHMRRMHGDEQLQCKVCEEIVESRYYFQKHMKGHTTIISSMKSSEKHSMKSSEKRSVKFSEKRSMKSSEKRSAKSSEKRSVSYNCVKCVQTFTSVDMFRQHCKLTHSTEPRKLVHSAGSMKSSDKRSMSYNCVKCVQTFTSNDMFRQHYKLTHSTEPHKLPHSTEPHKLAHSTEPHKLAHSTEPLKLAHSTEPHKLAHLNEPHKLAHSTGSMKSSEKPSVSYKCVKCVQTFTSNDMFRQHYQLTHSTEPHKHKKRNKEFLLETFFRLRTSHSDILQFECAICNKIYKSRPCLSEHVSEDHLHGFTEYSQQSVENGEGVHHPVGEVNAAASASTQRQDDFNMVEELASEELVLGPVPFERIDCNYQPYKVDPLLD